MKAYILNRIDERDRELIAEVHIPLCTNPIDARRVNDITVAYVDAINQCVNGDYKQYLGDFIKAAHGMNEES